MQCVFVQVRCTPGKAYKVADQIYKLEVASELYSTSGNFDLLMKLYVEDGKDVGKVVNGIVENISDINQTLTTLTFKAF
jgi:DNA-binding Lrp family transcriptional regulator